MEAKYVYILGFASFKVIFYGWHHGIHSSPYQGVTFFCCTPQPKAPPKTKHSKNSIFSLWKRYERKCRISGCILGFSLGFACVVVLFGCPFKKEQRKKILFETRKNLQPCIYKKDISYLPYPLGVCWWILVHHKCWLIHLGSATFWTGPLVEQRLSKMANVRKVGCFLAF